MRHFRPGTVWRPALWHALYGALILLAPVQRRADWPAWRLPDASLIQAGWTGFAYLLAAIIFTLLAREHATTSWGKRVAHAAMAFVLGFVPLLAIPLLLPAVAFSRLLFLAGGFIGALSLVLLASLREARWQFLSIPVAALALVISEGRALGSSDDFTVETQFYAVRVETQRPVPLDADTLIEGGGLTRFDDGLLLVTGAGRFARLERAASDSAWVVHELGLPSPANAAEFKADAPSGTAVQWFRVVDLLAERRGDSVVVTVTHHHWDKDARCFTLRVSESVGDSALSRWTPWRKRFDARPCLRLRDGARGLPFAGSAAGGRMLRLDSRGILLTVGDHQSDGLNAPEVLPQDSASDYGHTLLLNDDDSFRPFTLGHRNPQGLARDTEGRIWSTEHGPRGGDELNLLIEGANYGWPWRTHGVEYSLRHWPSLRDADSRWREPTFAFVPSPGISNLLAPTPKRFTAWQGDLLVGTLKVRELLRLRLNGDRVVYVEEIRLGFELRDIEEAEDGSLVAWTDQGVLLTLRPDDSDGTGAALAAQCAGCHTLNEGQAGALGPNLYEIIGRRVASQPGFAYSDALRSLGGRWTESRLDAFLRNPSQIAPGTTMSFPGISDSTARQTLIQYLRRSTRR